MNSSKTKLLTAQRGRLYLWTLLFPLYSRFSFLHLFCSSSSYFSPHSTQPSVFMLFGSSHLLWMPSDPNGQLKNWRRQNQQTHIQQAPFSNSRILIFILSSDLFIIFRPISSTQSLSNLYPDQGIWARSDRTLLIQHKRSKRRAVIHSRMRSVVHQSHRPLTVNPQNICDAACVK